MADQPVVAMAGAAVSRQDVLLATKLHVPLGGRVCAPPAAGRPAGGGADARAGPGLCPRFAQEREYLVLARVLLAQDRPGQALTLLDRVLDQAATGGRIGRVIEIRALQALAHEARCDEPAAMAALVEALTLASRRPGAGLRR
jgi:hypothetical protein